MISGVGVSGELDIIGNSTAISSGAIGISVSDDTDFGALNLSTDSKTNTYTITNSSTEATLIIDDVFSVENTNFTVDWSSDDDTLLIGESIEFDVTFVPTTHGAFYDTIRLISNDEDEGEFTFVVGGVGENTELKVSGSGNEISSGSITTSTIDGTDFGRLSVTSGSSVSSFLVENDNGNGDLVISSISMVDGTNFSVSGTTSGTLSPNSSFTFNVTFDPTTTGSLVDTVVLISDDSDELRYTFVVEGEGKTGAISLIGQDAISNYETIISGNTGTRMFVLDYGAVSGSKDFTISNTDLTVPLFINSISVSGTDAADFTITSSPSSILAGSSQNFTITFLPTSSGTKNATITILSDASTNSTYTFNIQAVSKEEVFTNSANIVMEGAVYWVSENMHFQNTGTFTAATGGTVKISGDRDADYTSISGAGTSSFYNLELDVSITETQLDQDITVSNQLIMTSGSLNLQGNDIDFGTTGSLVGENSTNYVYADGDGTLVYEVDLDAPTGGNLAGLGLSITSTADLGVTTIVRGHTSQTIGSAAGINRYFDISPSNNTGLDATLVWEYFDSELNGATESESESELELYRFDGSVWEDRDATLDAVNNTLIETNIEAFSMWSAAPVNIPLPIQLLSFDAKVNTLTEEVVLIWRTASEINNDYFVIEKTTDFEDYKFVVEVKGSGNAYHEIAYESTDQSPSIGTSYYRLKQVDYDGQYTYSDFVSIDYSRKFHSGVSVYPNPNLGTNILLDISHFEPNTQANIKVMNSTGEVFYDDEVITDDQGGFLSGILTEQTLVKGVYIVTVSCFCDVHIVKMTVH